MRKQVGGGDWGAGRSLIRSIGMYSSNSFKLPCMLAQSVRMIFHEIRKMESACTLFWNHIGMFIFTVAFVSGGSCKGPGQFKDSLIRFC